MASETTYTVLVTFTVTVAPGAKPPVAALAEACQRLRHAAVEGAPGARVGAVNSVVLRGDETAATRALAALSRPGVAEAVRGLVGAGDADGG